MIRCERFTSVRTFGLGSIISHTLTQLCFPRTHERNETISRPNERTTYGAFLFVRCFSIHRYIYIYILYLLAWNRAYTCTIQGGRGGRRCEVFLSIDVECACNVDKNRIFLTTSLAITIQQASELRALDNWITYVSSECEPASWWFEQK